MRILYIEDNAEDVVILKKTLKETGERINLFIAETLSSGIEYIKKEDIDVILLDLSLPDGNGMESLYKIQHNASLPIVIISGLDNEEIAIHAVHEGAQDYIVKEELNGKFLLHILRYAIERHGLLQKLRSLSLIDELTGLYNRRGFMHIAEHQLKLVQRLKKKMLLVFADVDGLEHINKTWGHKEGDLALLDIAKILRETFRYEDIIVRLKGDEFVALVLETSDYNTETTTTRLQQNLDAANEKGHRDYLLSLSFGIVVFDPEEPCSLDKLLERADELMVKQKFEKHNHNSKIKN